MKKVIKWKWNALVRTGTGGEGCRSQWASDKDLSHLWLTHFQRVRSPFTAGNSCQAGNNREKEWVRLQSRGVSLLGLYSLCLFLLLKCLHRPLTAELFFPNSSLAYSKIIQTSSFLFLFSFFFLVKGNWWFCISQMTNSCNFIAMKRDDIY